ncbi:hypothetical protein VKT23_009632 [Stygiomarasmius scandens]|uniref:Uncharacterized protein n=1 Tax=Marasmiellus scandens TaxID=2682957 RepID=A0ABR1JK90_9AGAR
MQGDMVNDPDMIAENERLSRWVNAWRMSLVSWSSWALNVYDSPEDKLATHCFVLDIDRRNSPSPAQFFRLRGTGVIPRTEVHEMFKEYEVPEKFIENWLEDQRGNETVQIVIISQGFVRLLYYSIRSMDVERTDGSKEFRRYLGDQDKWAPALIAAIEQGNVNGHSDYSQSILFKLTMEDTGYDLEAARRMIPEMLGRSRAIEGAE